ncbi:L-methionine gamma-lyase [Candidatus Magnetomoraceae bacterium gMMP-15]
MKKISKDTEIVHGIHTSHITSMDLVPPIHMTSTFKFKNAEQGAKVFQGTSDGYVYTRLGNPTIDLLQEKMALLEGSEAAIATSSGMSAIASVALSLARPGDNFVSCTTVYGGTFAFFNIHLRNMKIKPHFISPSSCSSLKEVSKLIDKNTKFLFIETPANPTLDIIDIELWASIAKKHNIPLIVDNTFASPYLQRPFQFGANAVVHSATKYLGGHGDIIGGIIVGSKSMIEMIKESYIIHYGPVMSPFNAWLILRGIKTLALRMEKHSDNAMKIAKWLDNHPKVISVNYPGLDYHSCYKIAEKQMKKYGGILAFEVKGGMEAGKKIMDNLELCALAVSLGDCETLIQHPASMTHSTYTKEEKQKAGITDGLIRLSVGIENPDDIIEDLKNAFDLI